MGLKKIGESARLMISALIVVCVAVVVLIFVANSSTTNASGDRPGSTAKAASPSAPSATFPGTGTGAIPDGPGAAQTPGAPLDISFAVTGISGPPSNVEVSMTATHSWVGDVKTTLIAPNGTSFVIFGYTGATTATSFGSSSDLSGAYNFKDSAAGTNWWTAAAATPVPAGDYRTTASGGAGQTNPAPVTNLTAAFSGVAAPNGTWILRTTDGGAGDTGSISAATLTIVGAAAPVRANADFNGDGKTDFTVARGTLTPIASGLTLSNDEDVRGSRSMGKRLGLEGNSAQQSPATPPIYWYTSLNGSGVTSVSQWGDAATDFIITQDFDGDNKSDIAVWREAAQGQFYILRSTNSTVQLENFGIVGDDPAVVGDYDGDGKADVAVYRCPAFGGPAGQCYFFYRGSLNNPSGNITYVPWGFGNDGDFFPNTGDFDGDGKNDFCVQRTNPSVAGQGQFVLLKTTGGVEYINWGSNSDFIIPGDYDGDGKADFCVRRTVSGIRQNWLLTRTGATSMTPWGITGDSSVPGDYDGDGKTDFAIWRPNADPTQNFFWVRNSSNGSVTQFEWGQCPVGSCDFPVAGWAVH